MGTAIAIEKMTTMEILNLPVFKDDPSSPRILSMDEYDEFVRFNLDNCVDLEAVRREKERLAVTAPFRLL